MGILDFFRNTRKNDVKNLYTYSGGTGESRESAIVIHAQSASVGVMAEYQHIESIFGKQDVDWTLKLQMKSSNNNREYDVLSIETKVGDKRKFYFDITEWFGKW